MCFENSENHEFSRRNPYLVSISFYRPLSQVQDPNEVCDHDLQRLVPKRVSMVLAASNIDLRYSTTAVQDDARSHRHFQNPPVDEG